MPSRSAPRVGSAGLETLGWWQLLAHLADAETRAAVFATFRAQGRELGNSAALGGLLAQPFIDRTAIASGTVVAAVRRQSRRRGTVWVTLGDIEGRMLLFDEPGRGAYLIDADAVELHPVDVPGRAVIQEISVDLDRHQPWLTDDLAHPARARSIYLGRIAAASEILGTIERAVDLSVEHAANREQFGQPIGDFQAVRHLLAWAKTDCLALDSILREAIFLFDDAPARYDEVVKAFAGRNGRRACERSLQVLGAIGFTAEHPHHHHHSRALLLDSLLGSSTELSHDLGAWLRVTGAEPGFARAVLPYR